MTKEEIETIIIKNYRAEFENYNYALCQNPKTPKPLFTSE